MEAGPAKMCWEMLAKVGKRCTYWERRTQGTCALRTLTPVPVTSAADGMGIRLSSIKLHTKRRMLHLN